MKKSNNLVLEVNQFCYAFALAAEAQVDHEWIHGFHSELCGCEEKEPDDPYNIQQVARYNGALHARRLRSVGE